jgi:hypothetical protein
MCFRRTDFPHPEGPKITKVSPGGPEEIGRAVTRAVVLSFMFIFVLNYLITRMMM